MRSSWLARGIVAVCVMLATSIVVIGCSESTEPDDGDNNDHVPLAAFRAQDVNENSFTCGSYIDFNEYSAGKAALIYFGRATCSGCRHEFGGIDLLIKELLCEGYPVVGAMINSAADSDPAEQQLLREVGARIPALQDTFLNGDPAIGTLLGCTSGDELIVVDTTGMRVKLVRIGATHDMTMTDAADRETVKDWLRDLSRPGVTNCLTLEGYVRTDEGVGVPSVIVYAEYDQTQTTETDEEGHWIFSKIIADSITIRPEKAGCTILPQSLTFHASADDIEFIASCPWSSVSGHVRDRFGNGIWDVTVAKGCDAGGSATTDANGYWVINEIVADECVFTPAGEHLSFNPPSQTIAGSEQDVDFTGTWDLNVPDFTRLDVNPNSPTVGTEISFSDIAAGKKCLLYFGYADCSECIAQYSGLGALADELAADQIEIGAAFVNHPYTAPYADDLEIANTWVPAFQDTLIVIDDEETPALQPIFDLDPWVARSHSVLVLIDLNSNVLAKAFLGTGYLNLLSAADRATVREWLEVDK